MISTVWHPDMPDMPYMILEVMLGKSDARLTSCIAKLGEHGNLRLKPLAVAVAN